MSSISSKVDRTNIIAFEVFEANMSSEWANRILSRYGNGPLRWLSREIRTQRLPVACAFRSSLVRLRRETGGLEPKPQGNPGRGKLSELKDRVRPRIAAQPDWTIDELTAELGAEHGLKLHRSSVGRLLHRLGLSHEKRSSGA